MNERNDLVERTRAWIAADPDPETRRELSGLLEAGKWEEIHERMGGVLEFGTAGIRGAVEAGSNRMNRAVVIRTTAGLSRFLEERRSGPVVVGFDGRHSSPAFAEDTVGVLAAAGHEVHYFPRPVPTPFVAFQARRVGAAAAVVITASHNPPADNGYKVYDSNAAQIIPPVDGEIAAAIEEVGPASEVPRVEGALERDHPLIRPIDEDEVYEAYRQEVDGVRPRRTGSDLVVAYTPIHGVGWRILARLTRDAGYPNVNVVDAQRDPDGSFPTVEFPNPEEAGAMDLVMELGTELEADLVVANDPDVDRLAVAVPDDVHGWRLLTGNQVGVLLADWLLESWSSPPRPIVINSIVSSPMLAEVAGAHGALFEQTLTGFKWISNAAMDLERQGEGRFVFGYEEALGYSVGPVVRDKDGMSAAVVFLDLAASLREVGMSVRDRLEDLYRRVGLWVSTQLSVVRPGSEGVAEIASAMDRLGEHRPRELSGWGVASSLDFRSGAEGRPRWLPATSLVALELEGGGRVLVRPSGTEPKLKVYVDLFGEPGADPAGAERDLTLRAEEVAETTARFLGF